MVKRDAAPSAKYAPLLAQRRGRRERALATLYDRHGGQVLALLPEEVVLDAHAAAAQPSGGRLGGLGHRLLRAVFGGHRHTRPPNAAPPTPLGSAAAAAALAQRITGPGSGPYSGTPFHPEVAAPADPRRTTAGAQVSEAARHDHGIIDHSRHVSSIGRR
jgi:hypothetical protein